MANLFFDFVEHVEGPQGRPQSLSMKQKSTVVVACYKQRAKYV